METIMPKSRKRKIKKKFSRRRKPSFYKFAEGLDRASDLMERGNFLEARELLTEIDRRFPNDPEVLVCLADVSFELRDMQAHQEICERLIKFIPDDSSLLKSLAGSYLVNMRIAHSLRMFKRFLSLYPDHEDADHARETVAKIEEQLNEHWENYDLSEDEMLEMAILHEEAQIALEKGELKKGISAAEKLLTRVPDFVSARNNLSQVLFLDNQTERAIKEANRVLDADSENAHALSNLARFLFLDGSEQEARDVATRLKKVETKYLEIAVKKAEVFSYLGDDETMIEIFEDAKEKGLIAECHEPLIFHLTAFAQCRLGREKEARELWNQSLKISQDFSLAIENLEELRKPIGERNPPYAYPLNQWITKKIIEELVHLVESASHRKDDNAITETARKFLKEHPEIEKLLPALFDRCGYVGCEFAQHLASMAKTPAAIQALRDFAFSQHGTDQMRNEAAMKLSKENLIEEETVGMWIQGEWREIMLIGYEIYTESDEMKLPHKAEKLMMDAYYALNERNGERAEVYLKKALELVPDNSSILHNLGAAYMYQKREKEAEEIFLQIYENDAEYLFARTSLAKIYLQRKQIDEAQELIKPLTKRKRLHISEFRAMCDANMELLTAQKNKEGARSWLKMWEALDDDSFVLDHWRMRLTDKKSLLKQMIFGRGK